MYITTTTMQVQCTEEWDNLKLRSGENMSKRENSREMHICSHFEKSAWKEMNTRKYHIFQLQMKEIKHNFISSTNYLDTLHGAVSSL